MNEHNSADGNIYASMPAGYLRILDPEPQQWLDLAAAREFYGWDKNGAAGQMQADFDPDQLELTVSYAGTLPRVGTFNHIDSDMSGAVTEYTRPAGPFADLNTKRARHVDPRSTLRK